MSPKPAYEHLRRLIKGEWWTSEHLLCNEKGMARWRGFYGLYRLTVEYGGKKIVTRAHLAKGAENIFKVELP